MVRGQDVAPPELWLDREESRNPIVESPTRLDRLAVDTRDFIHRIGYDFENFYANDTPLLLGLSVAAAAPIANTYADRRLSEYYQRHVQPGETHIADNAADYVKFLGDHRYTVPICAAISFSDLLFPESATASTIGEFGQRSLRALAVGAPSVGILQSALGSMRPQGDSRWHPFRSHHGVSGHTFVGAVPFLTAAAMSDSYFLKTLFIAGSFGVGWSRIHHDAHYISQVALGWGIAFLAVRAVNITEGDGFRMRLAPAEVANGVGLGVQIDY